MKSLTLQTVADFAGGRLEAGDANLEVGAVSTDTRTLQPSDLYVALVGESFDGHRFVGAAIEAGARAVLVADGFELELPEGIGCVRVADTLVGLQSLAKGYRELLGLKVIGVTGSNGKTSTKDLIASVLAERFEVCATRGNFNNHIGLPLTILSADENNDFGVWEMGMSNPGEIEVLAKIATPDIGVITNVGVAHIEFMKSREAIALEKGMLAEAIGEDGLVVLNAEDGFSDSIADRTNAKVVLAGVSKGDVQAKDVEVLSDGSRFTLVVPGGEQSVTIGVPGRHMVGNALLAAAIGLHAGLSLEEIASGLGKAVLTGGRLARREIGGITFIDDSYNANPDSVLAALATLAEQECAGRRFAVLGGMAELGEQSDSEHRRVGKAAAASGIDFVISVGDIARPVVAGVNGSTQSRVEHFDDVAACAAFLSTEAGDGDLVLVKGSRSSAMEKLFTEFENA